MIDWVGLSDKLNLKQNARGWYSSDELECPECHGKGGKFGILKTESSGLVSCWKCGYKANIYSYLNVAGLSEHYSKSKKYDLINFNEPKQFRQVRSDKALEEVELPIGWIPIKYDKYLKSRNFQKYHFSWFKPIRTNHHLEPKWKDLIIFQIFQDDKLVGLMGRSRHSKEWHDKNLESFRNGETELLLRFRNSENDFSKILGGFQFANKDIDTVILVEGLFDKVNIDKLLNLQNSDSKACFFVYGSKLSQYQINLLKGLKRLKKIIILFDPDALKKVKHILNNLFLQFNSIQIGILNENDPGDLEIEELNKILNNLKSVQDTFTIINKYE